MTQADINSLNTTLENIVNDEAKKDGVLEIVMVPGEFFSPSGNTARRVYFLFPSKLGTYTPRNKKLLSYPYNALYVSNNQGNTAEYKYEDFLSDTRLSFQVWGNISMNPGMLCAPYNYKHINGVNYDEKITLEGFPMCAWTYDAYRAWLAQNAGTITAAGIGLAARWATALTIPVMGAISGDMGISHIGMDAVPYIGQHTEMGQAGYGGPVQAPSGSLLAATLGAMGQIYDHKRMPPQASGSANGSLNFQSGLATFMFMQKHIKPEFARIIDDYFDMYGYAIHRHAVPNRSARRCYTYVKTIGCSIHGNLPSDDALIIQGIFNRGVRFWKPSAVFGNYDPAVNNNSV